MSVEVTIIDGPLPPHQPTSAPSDVGAFVLFDGVVRGLEGGEAIAGLSYEVYEPMASRELGRLATRMFEFEGVRAIRVWHSRGFVPVAKPSFRLQVMAAHRKEALRAVDEFIDSMKRDIPIWKRAERSAPSP